MKEKLKELFACINKTEKNYDKQLIERAFNVADKAHEGQFRRSGEPYVTHPVSVACILAELGMDSECLCAALLHDVVEDTQVTIDDIKKEFGADIALLVDGVTKLGRVSLTPREVQQAENVRKMLLAMAQDVRVIIIKLADRLHNLRTIAFMPPQKQRDICRETMEIYAPLAHRLGIRAVKEELEDISLKYLDPVAYNEIERTLTLKKTDRENFISEIKKEILTRLEEQNIKDAFIEGRVKSFYGIYRKVYMAGRAFEEVYDIYAVRIIVSTVIECYNILGIIHDLFRPIPNRFKDYISTPKPNMYQSLHTTVINEKGVPFEIQIRTWDMHYTAEYGIAAHWKYKAGIQGKDKLEERLAWVRQIIEAEKETEDVEDIVRTIKTDIGSEEVYVFTPRGDVKSLPVGSNVIDFAYAIHTEVGNRMTGAKIDGRIVSLDTKVKTGQIVEIITTNSQNHGPNRDWIKLVKTNEARTKIRSWFKREKRDENIIEGKAELAREFKRNQINIDIEKQPDFVKDIAERHHFENTDDFYAAIGYGGIILSRIIPRIKEDYIKAVKAAKAQEISEEEIVRQAVEQASSKKSSSGIIVEGIDNCLVKLSKCCSPLPGDPIIGFITRGYGVSVHRADCVNAVAGLADESQKGRWIKVHWADKESASYQCRLDIVAVNRSGLAADVTVAISGFRVPIHELNARELKNGNANLTVTISIAGKDQLDSMIQKISKISGIISVERSTPQ